MKASLAAIAIALLVIVLIVSPVGVLVSAMMGSFGWTTTFIIAMFSAVGIVAIASKVMDRQDKVSA